MDVKCQYYLFMCTMVVLRWKSSGTTYYLHDNWCITGPGHHCWNKIDDQAHCMLLEFNDDCNDLIILPRSNRLLLDTTDS